ncbi:hypothetical protein, partial [Allorhizocola rhizosphaerae]|uniref:hypothetical protein n=1 Tax=Allorhizocola rhizosphaerae TaxID=1872709 RepID=UPI001B8BAFD9
MRQLWTHLRARLRAHLGTVVRHLLTGRRRWRHGRPLARRRWRHHRPAVRLLVWRWSHAPRWRGRRA